MKHVIKLSLTLLLCFLFLFSWVYGEEVSMDGMDMTPGENELPLDWEEGTTDPTEVDPASPSEEDLYLTYEEAMSLTSQEALSLIKQRNRIIYDYCTLDEADADSPSMLPSYYIDSDDPEIIAKANEIVAGIDNDYDKLYAIHKWVCNNISYDYVLYNAHIWHSATASHVLEVRSAICGGYANLAAAFCRAVGIPCNVAAGMTYEVYEKNQVIYSTQSQLSASHAWNMALVDGRWVIFDSTWGIFDKPLDDWASSRLFTMLYDSIDYMDCHISISNVEKILEKYVGNNTPLVSLPEFINVIGYQSFEGNQTIQEIHLPSQLKTLRYRAFADCSSLTDITFSDKLRNMEEQVFDGCNSLKSVDLSCTQVEELLNAVFCGCTSLESVKLPDTLKTVGSLAFYDCEKLSAVDLSNSVTRIEEAAFGRCSLLTSLTAPSVLEYVGDNAFELSGLISIILPDSVREIGEYAFSQCAQLTSVTAKGVEIIGDYAFYGSPLESFTFGPKVTTIGEKAFWGTPIREAILPEGLETLELEVFYECPNLTRAHIPSTLREAPDAFEGSALADVTFALGRDAIPERLFNGCKSLQKVQIPHGVKTIEPTAFKNCYSLKELTLPEGLEKIEDHSFYNCTGLTSVPLPKTVTYIGYNAFSGCTELAQITPPDTIEYIGSGAFYDTAYLKNKNNWSADGALYFADALVSVRVNTAGTFVIPEGTRAIAEKAFSGCTLLKHITIPEGIGTIAERQFQGCTGLKSIDLPKDLTTIGKYAFSKCTALETLVIPEGVKNIPMFMCDGCTGLKELSLPRGLESIDSCAFRYCSSLTSVELPESLTQILGSAFYGCTGFTEIEIPSAVSYIVGDTFTKCSSLKAFRVAPENRWFSTDEKGVLFNKKKTLLHTYPGGLEGSYTVPETVEIIGAYAFTNCKGLTAVVLPTGLLIIENSAFNNCTGLTSVDFPLTLKEICSSAFTGCTGLTEVFLPHSLNLLDGGAFSLCNNLKDLTIFSKNCYIDEFIVYTMGTPGTTTIHAYAGSVAASRAKSNGFTFEALEKPILDETIAIYHSLNLASDISINYAVAAEVLASYDSFFLKCSLPERLQNKPLQEDHLVILPEKKGDYYYFTLDGLTAVELGETLNATLYMVKDGTYYTSPVDRYSVATYALSQISRTNVPDSLRVLCANLLRYGSAAQIWRDYRTHDLADKNLEDSYKERYQTDLETLTFGNNNRVLNDLPGASVTWVGKALSLENKVVVRFILDPSGYDGYPEDLSLRVTYTNPEGKTMTHVVTDCTLYNKDLGLYTFDFSELNASDLRCVLSVAVYAGDTRVSSTLEYSPDTYGNKKTDTLLTLCKAMIAYSDSAAAFFAS